MRLSLIFILFFTQLAGAQEMARLSDTLYLTEITLKPRLSLFELTKKERVPFAVGVTLAALSGVADAYHHMITNHYSEFKRRHPGADDDYWDRRISWTKKYRNYPDDQRAAYFGSKTFLVWTTDGWHLTDMLARSSFTLSLTINFIGNEKDRRPWWHQLVYAGVMSGVRNVVFEIVHP